MTINLPALSYGDLSVTAETSAADTPMPYSSSICAWMSRVLSPRLPATHLPFLPPSPTNALPLRHWRSLPQATTMNGVPSTGANTTLAFRHYAAESAPWNRPRMGWEATRTQVDPTRHLEPAESAIVRLFLEQGDSPP